MKQAVVYILDVSSPGDSSDDSSSLLGCAKRTIQTMIGNLMLQSITNEVCVIACKTPETSHHMVSAEDIEEDVPLPNLTELTDGVMRPTIEVLRNIRDLEVVSNEEAFKLRGSCCDAIVLATDALYSRTNKKKYERKIILVTDATRDIVMDAQQVLTVVDALRNMECQLEVIGIDFEPSFPVVFDEPTDKNPSSTKRQKLDSTVKDEESEQNDGDDPAEQEKMKEGEEERVEEKPKVDKEDCDGLLVYSEKADRERLLQSLVKKTGGRIVPANTAKAILDLGKGHSIKTSQKSKVEFRLAPGIVLQARSMLLAKKEPFPRMKTHAVLLDESGKPQLGVDGTEVTEVVKNVAVFAKEDDLENVVDLEDKKTAIRYGKTLVPMSEKDLMGLRDKPFETGPLLEILAYMPENKVPPILMMGPPYVFSGGDSQRGCAAISALAKALKRLAKVAICKFIKTGRSIEAILGALLPFQNDGYAEPMRLVFLQLPFAGEVRSLPLHMFDDVMDPEEEDHNKQERAADDLVDSLMLPDTRFTSGSIHYPILQSWKETVIQRSLDPKAPVVNVRDDYEDDPMLTPADLLDRAKPALESFSDCFPLSLQKEPGSMRKKKAGRAGRKVVTHHDYL